MSPRIIPTLPADPEEVESVDTFVEVLWAAAMVRFLEERELDERESIDVYCAGSVLVANAMVHEGGMDPDKVMRAFEEDPTIDLGLTSDLDITVRFTWEDGRGIGVLVSRKEPGDE
jgi:hypothetical protein